MPRSASNRRSSARWGRRYSRASWRRSGLRNAHDGGGPIRAHYGYADGGGEYYITIDTDRCDGCGDCVAACPADLFEVVLDDYDEPKAVVTQASITRLAELCPGADQCAEHQPNCHQRCAPDAITHSW